MSPYTAGGLTGRTALVVGEGAIAEAIAASLAAAGARIAALAGPASAAELQLVEASLAETERDNGPVDIVVHAWDQPFEQAAEETDPERWKSVVQNNVKSKFLYAKAASKGMLERGRGNIVFVTSIAGLVAWPGAAAYSAAQGAIHQVTRTLGVEWAKRGVRVNAIAATLTEGLDGADRIVRLTPLGRAAGPDDIAACVSYLVSDASGLVTGQIVNVDGGYVTI